MPEEKILDDRPQFNFMRSYLDSLSGFDDETAGKCILALAKYALNNELPDLSDPVLNMYFSLIRPIVDLGRTRANARRKKESPDPEDPDHQPDKTEKRSGSEKESDQAAGLAESNQEQISADKKQNIESKKQNIESEKQKGEVKKQNKNKIKTKSKQNEIKSDFCSGFAFLKEKDKEKEKEEDKDVFLSARARERTNTQKDKVFMNLKMKDVVDYARERGYEFQPGDYNRFIQYNSARGWKIGATPVEDWRPLVDLWITSRVAKETGRKEDYPERKLDPQELAHKLDRALFDLPLSASKGDGPGEIERAAV